MRMSVAPETTKTLVAGEDNVRIISHIFSDGVRKYTPYMSEEPKTEREARIAGKIVDVNEDEIRGHLDEMVRNSVEDTLNALLDAEADRLCGAGRYERSADRADTRARSYRRKLRLHRILLRHPPQTLRPRLSNPGPIRGSNPYPKLNK